MNEIIIGTTNQAKVKQIIGALKTLNIQVNEIKNINLLPQVKEDGTTAQENARKKAIAYAKALNKIVLSMDNALFIDGLNSEEQPRINVRRIYKKNNQPDNRPSDEELIKYYSSLIGELGEKVNGHWEFAICVASPK